MRRKVHFMAKSQLFKRPLQFIYTHGGVFPVRRGHRDTRSIETAKAILGRGDLIVMYAEGGRSRTGELGEAKPGVGKLALETGVPVVPTAIVGTERARNWKRLQFPKVTVQYGDPIRFEKVEDPTREQSQAAADVVFARDQGAARRAARGRTGGAGARSQRRPRGTARCRAQAAEAGDGVQPAHSAARASPVAQSCPGMISAPGRLLAVELDLLQRAAELVLVGHLVRAGCPRASVSHPCSAASLRSAPRARRRRSTHRRVPVRVARA